MLTAVIVSAPAAYTTANSVPNKGELASAIPQNYTGDNGEATIHTPRGDIKVPVFDGRSLAILRELANKTGISYMKDFSTNKILVNGTLITPVGKDAMGRSIVKVRDFLNAAGIPDKDIVYDPVSRNITYNNPESKTSDPTKGCNTDSNKVGTSPKQQPTKQEPAKVEQKSAQQIEEEQFKSSCKRAEYNDLLQVDQYVSKNVMVIGNLVQKTESGDSVTLKVNVTKDSSGNWSDTVLVIYPSSSSLHAAEDDIITVWGIVRSSNSTQSNSAITPVLDAKYISLKN